jgi:chromosome partitioning protein
MFKSFEGLGKRGVSLLDLEGTRRLHKIVVLNPKGGSGKTTLAFNLAGYLASTGRRVGLLDMDRQGSSSHWLGNRPSGLAEIRALVGPDASGKIPVPDDIEFVVVDAPAGLGGEQLIDYTCGAHAILVPVLPSDLDIHAASRLVKDLLLVAQVSRRNGRLGIVANRVKERTIAYRQLMRFLESLSIRLVGVLRDSQNYTRAAALGRCIHELPPSQAGKDLEQWRAVTNWLEDRLATPLNARDHLRPAESPGTEKRRRHPVLFSAAAAIGAVAVVTWFLLATQPAPVEESDSRPATEAFRSTPVEPIQRAASQSAAETRAEAVGPGDHEPSPDAGLDDRWQLTGVVRANGESVIVLASRRDDHTVSLTHGGELDGWVVTESGPDFAVLVQDGEKIRLRLNEDRFR